MQAVRAASVSGSSHVRWLCWFRKPGFLSSSIHSGSLFPLPLPWGPLVPELQDLMGSPYLALSVRGLSLNTIRGQVFVFVPTCCRRKLLWRWMSKALVASDFKVCMERLITTRKSRKTSPKHQNKTWGLKTWFQNLHDCNNGDSIEFWNNMHRLMGGTGSPEMVTGIQSDGWLWGHKIFNKWCSAQEHLPENYVYHYLLTLRNIYVRWKSIKAVEKTM